MISGDFYSNDGKLQTLIMNTILQEAIINYDLKNIKRNGKQTGTFSNGKCTVAFWVSDRRSFKWHFYNQNEEFKYKPSYYLEFILKKERPRMTISPSITTIDELIKEIFINYNRELMDFLDAPMNGDFSWHDVYCEGVKKRLKHAEFASRIKKSDSEEKLILSRMFFRGESGRDEAIENYLKKHYPNGGKEFEVDDIWKL